MENPLFLSSIPTLFYSIAVHFLVHGSPRLLFVRGRKEETIATLQCTDSINSTPAKIPLTSSFLSRSPFEQETCNVDVCSAITSLIKRRWAFWRLSAVMSIGFGVGMVYYGMPLALGNLDFNLYLSVTLNGLSELPASLITFFFIDKMKSKISILVLTGLSRACSIMSVLKWNDPMWTRLLIGFELVLFFTNCLVFNVLLIFTIKLFPTCVRNLALFVVCLPETRGGRICDTMEEEEYKET